MTEVTIIIHQGNGIKFIESSVYDDSIYIRITKDVGNGTTITTESLMRYGEINELYMKLHQWLQRRKKTNV